MTTTVFHRGPAYELSVSVQRVNLGHQLEISSLVPTARHPHRQVRFQSVLSAAELAELHRAIGQALAGASVQAIEGIDPAVQVDGIAAGA